MKGGCNGAKTLFLVWNMATGEQRAEFIRELCRRYGSLICRIIKEEERCKREQAAKES